MKYSSFSRNKFKIKYMLTLMLILGLILTLSLYAGCVVPPGGRPKPKPQPDENIIMNVSSFTFYYAPPNLPPTPVDIPAAGAEKPAA
ncbi:MAG: hypothetical protein CVU88_04475 [Firmicutes bacterium HGW-Firmicutes-13]|nr:MAG: hypothetical protein CVU88_04475 [Firmicutes bacterium HGW-Firmicutes-13]